MKLIKSQKHYMYITPVYKVKSNRIYVLPTWYIHICIYTNINLWRAIDVVKHKKKNRHDK